VTEITTFEAARRAVRAGTSAADAARALVRSLTPEQRLWCLDGDLPAFTGLAFIAAEDGYHRAPFVAGRIDAVGLPGLAFSDGPRGCVTGNATAFPVTMARGATWDVELEERVGAAIGAELAARGANLSGAVCVNLLRHPAWGRAQETYGEDPFHVGELGAALTRGLQRHVMACVKHYAANSMENARFKVDVSVDEVALHEVFLPHFRRIVDEGVASVMSAYNRVNGQWCGESEELLTDVLRGEWGFEGFVISDWVFGLRDAARSLTAGLDVEMPARMLRYEALPAVLEAGTVSGSAVEEAATRVVATMLRFDPVLGQAPDPLVIGCTAHRALAREVAGRAVVLLRNEAVQGTPVLPLDPANRVAVIGDLGDVVNLGDAGSSDVWDLHCRTVVDGMGEAFAEVIACGGSDPRLAAEVAAGADVALVVVGYTRLDEGEYMGDLDSLPTEVFPASEEPEVVAAFERWKQDVPTVVRPGHVGGEAAAFGAGGDRASLRLSPSDVALIRAVAAANPRTVVAVQAGSAVIASEWIDQVPAVVQSWYAGAEAGPALADVLAGVVNPSGRLPFTVPVDERDLPPFDRDAEAVTYDRWHGWWHLRRAGTRAGFPFGFGLSYTTFAIDDGVATVVEDDHVVVRGTVRNTGPVAGSDVVQVYAELPDPSRPPRLVGFTRLDVEAGAAAPFEVRVPVERLATRYPRRRAWRPPAGPHRLRAARHAEDRSVPAATIEL